MRLKNDWLPYSLAGRARVLNQIRSNIDQYGPTVGLSAGEIARVKEIADAFNYAWTAVRLVEHSAKAVVAWRRHVMDGKRKIGDPASPPPVLPVLNPPPGTTIGLIAELRKIVARIKTSPNYTRELATALGIGPPPESQLSINEISPKLKLSASVGGKLTVRGVMMTMDALRLEFAPVGSKLNWRPIGFLTSLPATIDVELPEGVTAEAGYIRGTYLKKNKLVGQWTSPLSVTFTK